MADSNAENAGKRKAADDENNSIPSDPAADASGLPEEEPASKKQRVEDGKNASEQTPDEATTAGKADDASGEPRASTLDKDVGENNMSNKGGPPGQPPSETEGTAIDALAVAADVGDAKDGKPAGEKRSVPVRLGPKTFTSGVEMFTFFLELLRGWSPNHDVNEFEHQVLLDLIRKGHSDPEAKMGAGVKAFQVRMHPEYGTPCFFLVRLDGSAADFSYRKCVEALAELPAEYSLRGGGGEEWGGRGGDRRDGRWRGRGGEGGRGGRGRWGRRGGRR